MTTKSKPSNLSGTIRLLKRMVEDGVIRSSYYSPTDPELYFLPAIRALTEYQIKHEKLCGDLYVAYENTGAMKHWEVPAGYEEMEKLGLEPDRQMLLNGVICFLEVDRGTEDYFTKKGILGKVQRYIELARLHPGKRFHVIFTAIDGKQTAKARCSRILELLEDYPRGNQFLTLPHRWAVSEPLGAVYMSPKSPMGLALGVQSIGAPDVQPANTRESR